MSGSGAEGARRKFSRAARVRRLIVAAAGSLGVDRAKVDRRLPSRSWWLKRPRNLPRELCLFVTLARQGRVPAHATYHARAWQAAGFGVVLIVIAGDDEVLDASNLGFADAILLRENRGYDFGAWADVIRRLRRRRLQVNLLAITNDSIFGPLSNFPQMLERVRASDADVIGLTDSYERVHHLQSFLLFFTRKAIASKAFRNFWFRVRQGDRYWVIDQYELRLNARMKAGGLTTAALFESSPNMPWNQTLLHWRQLVECGFTYVKAMLLRDNPYDVDIDGWRDFIREWGYDPQMVDFYFEQNGWIVRNVNQQGNSK